MGVAAMLLVKNLGRRAKGPVGLMSVTAIDILCTASSSASPLRWGPRLAFLLTVALTIEVLFLGLTIANALGASGAFKGRRVVGSTAAMVVLLPLGALLGGSVATLSATVQAGFLAFGLIALLYLVTEIPFRGT